MTDDLEERKEETWGMSEVRSTGAESETDEETESDATDAADPGTTAATGEATDGLDTEDTSETPDSSDFSDTSDTSDPDDRSATGNPSESDGAAGESAVAAEATVRRMAREAEANGVTVRDLHNVNVYLYEDVYREMVATFKRLDSEYFGEHGDELGKNKEFFNAVFRAGLQSPHLREELELE